MITVEEIERDLEEMGSHVSRPVIERAIFEVLQGTPDHIKADMQISAKTTATLMVMAWIRGFSAALEMKKGPKAH